MFINHHYTFLNKITTDQQITIEDRNHFFFKLTEFKRKYIIKNKTIT